MAGIRFTQVDGRTPLHVRELLSSLSYWPKSVSSVTDVAEGLTEGERDEVDSLTPRLFTVREGRTEPLWIPRITYRILKPLIRAHDEGVLTGTMDELWNRGGTIVYHRRMSCFA